MKRQPEPATSRTIRRHQLRDLVPLADTNIYHMEQGGEIPQRSYLTARCLVWDLSGLEASWRIDVLFCGSRRVRSGWRGEWRVRPPKPGHWQERIRGHAVD